MNAIACTDACRPSRCSGLVYPIIPLLLLALPIMSGYTAAGEREDQFGSAALEGSDDPETAVQSWLFPGAGRRLPLKERRLQDGAQRGLIPPGTTEKGFSPRIGLAVEYQNNLFFTDTNQRDDVITVLSPGIRYSDGGKGWNLEADYGFEAAKYFDNSKLNKVLDAQSGLLFANRELSRRLTVGLSDNFYESRDTSDQLIRGVLTGATTVTNNDLSVELAYTVTPNVRTNISYSNLIILTNDSAATDIRSNEVTTGLRWRVTPRDTVGLEYEGRRMDFTRVDEATGHSVLALYRRQFSRRFALEGGAGYLTINKSFDTDTWSARLSAQASMMKEFLIGLNYNRDVLLGAGVGAPLLENTLNLNMLLRIRPGLRFGAELGKTRFKIQDSFRTRIDSVDVLGFLSYALTDNIWVRARYSHNSQKVSGTTIRNNRYLVNMVFSL
ncbi:MAG TPA: hypothetical protein ENI68_03540 [Gammaproteobacteria bacterium]|nr:hypothetical protein [Gammaproteobacteria bacterium]